MIFRRAIMACVLLQPVLPLHDRPIFVRRHAGGIACRSQWLPDAPLKADNSAAKQMTV